ncbi:PqiB protein [Pseudomonas savastanoi pv. glycinea]|uniref:PqiB protein n=2 Tax=Pseudomonas savastanoi TaxID=29438 RepID=A0A3M4MR16_PSESG|nr:PqiB protein [Pseudomonas savastanoi pv. glycinea]RMQ48860.1 PqiB protein [Pseudomonas savastanoi pv. phaseolicola]RMQ56049.1 PqiB protein [Pseudomonas savastanoi pv. glycinea]RMT08726.1 PqiB protein [Pseudomonas savastanoi pv. phaseolicola]RMV69463.1 PqiB protein [Pseudomonas savastanoi pv. glycinea]
MGASEEKMSDRSGSVSASTIGASITGKRRFGASPVWLIPVIAALVCVSLLISSSLSKGPRIFISFQSAEGLEAHKTRVKVKNVVIGEVSAVTLSKDRTGVVATVDLNADARAFTAEDSMFWVVRPRIGAKGVSGVDTLLSGPYIAADSGTSEHPKKHFIGQESPPPLTFGAKGTRFTLHAEDMGSLDVGSPVYYRRIQVGQVVACHLSEDGKGVDAEIFINAPNDRFVTTDTRFWNASGIGLTVDADGLKIKTESVSTLLAGGVAFVEPGYGSSSPRAAEHARFKLFEDQQKALSPPDGEPGYIRMMFRQSLRGLEVNSPVEFMGINLGRVISVDLDYDAANKSFSSIVGAVIYPERLGQANEKIVETLGTPDDSRTAQLIADFVKQGLRAQPRSASLLTGQLYISLEFFANAAPVQFDVNARPLIIPTVPGELEKMQEQVQLIVEKVSKLPMQEIAGNLNGSLDEAHKTFKLFNADVMPELHTVLGQSRSTMEIAGAALAEDSPVRQQVSRTMDEVQRTARSVRVLTDYISRNPEALIRGRTRQDVPSVYPQANSAPRPD